MKFLQIILCVLLIGCNAKNADVLEAPNVWVDVIVNDSIYDMVIHNRINGITEEQLKTNYISLITSRTDEKERANLIEAYDNFFTVSYIDERNSSILNALGGKWLLEKPGEVADTLDLSTGNFNFVNPNILLIPFDQQFVPFTVNATEGVFSGTGLLDSATATITKL